MTNRLPPVLLLLALGALGACDDDPTDPGGTDRPFYEGTEDDPQIGMVVHTLDNTLRLFQVGDPDQVREVALGASSAVTPTGVVVGGNTLAVPLGNAASVAIIDAETQRIERFLLFPSGNATGAAFHDRSTLLVANLLDDQVGRATLDQEGDEITELVAVAPAPTDIEMSAGRALVLSGNLDADFLPLGPGVVTALDPTTLEVLGTVETGGQNPTASAVGPDGHLYVVNTGDFVSPATLAIIDPVSLELVELVQGAGVGPGAITVDDQGLAYISGFFLGTVIFDTASRSWIRGPEDPVCAPLSGGGCRGAFDAVAAADGRLYQAFFGSPGEGLAPQIFVYDPGSWALSDSLPAGQGPATVRITSFEPGAS
jgi:hypothetical protein